MTSALGLNYTQLTRNLLTSIAAIQGSSGGNYELAHANRKLQDVSCITAIRNAFHVCSESPASPACITEIDSSADICINGVLSSYCQEKMSGMITSDCSNFAEFNQTLYSGLIKEEDNCPNLQCSISIVKTQFCKNVSESEISEIESRIEDTVRNSCYGLLSSHAPSEKPTQFPSEPPVLSPSPKPSEAHSKTPSQAPTHSNLRSQQPSLMPISLKPESQPSEKKSSSLSRFEKGMLAISAAAVTFIAAIFISAVGRNRHNDDD